MGASIPVSQKPDILLRRIIIENTLMCFHVTTNPFIYNTASLLLLCFTVWTSDIFPTCQLILLDCSEGENSSKFI